jgi:acetoacetyl-CoA synthetase
MAPLPLIATFRKLAERKTGRAFTDFEDLHRWSVEAPEEFWRLLWEFEDIESATPVGRALASEQMPGASWFPQDRVNYARQVLRHSDAAHAAGEVAIIAEDERGFVETVDWPTLSLRVASLALSLRAMGVGKGDRVAAYLPNRPEAVTALLACASIGAIWAICAPDMGAPAIVDRFQQIAPKILIATDGVLYAGKEIDRSDVVGQLRDALPSVEKVILVRSGYAADPIADTLDFHSLTSTDAKAAVGFEPEWLPFDHPLWIVYSSGTTGKPKALVHGHGGILLGAAAARLHSDLGPSYDERTRGERFHWFSSTGWMMWNSQVNGLLGGTTICIFDGSPSGSRNTPDLSLLWRFAAGNRVTFFGSGAQFYTLCEKQGIDFGAVGDLTSLRALGSTASPLPAGVQSGISERLEKAGKANIWWFNSSGGTDICGAFCTGNRELPEVPGKLQCRQLGAAVEAWNASGEPVTDEVGELVVTRPMPNMPLFLWGDEDGSRYRESYFEHFPGVWRHGDWLRIEADGSCEIFGRSDATINRAGHRMGTSEIYSAVEALDGVVDSLVVDVRVDDADSRLLLFVVTETREQDLDALAEQIRQQIRLTLSPRFLPDAVFSVSAIPRTLSSKKLELPIKRLLEGVSVDHVVERSAMANPGCLQEYEALATKFRQSSLAIPQSSVAVPVPAQMWQACTLP